MKKTLLLCILLFAFCILLTACGNKCEHTYDNACDVTCNECGEERTVTHDFADADCLNPKTCTVCGKTEGSALGHKPAEDDGDCTTPVKCKNCNEIVVSGNQTHTYGTITYTWADDYSSCTAMRKCTVNGCQSTETETKAATRDGAIFTVDFDNEAFETQRVDTSVQIGNVTVNPWNEAPLIDAGEAEEQYGKENEQ